MIQYLDGSTAAGDYVADTFEIGDATVNALQFGAADLTHTGQGVLGIGLTANEATKQEYPNLVDAMLSQGLITQKAYSLYLNDYFSSTGSILFGGVDTEKFIDDLAVVPILPDSQSNNYTSFTVAMTSLNYTFSNGTSSQATLAGNSLLSVLDSGTTLTYLPEAVATPFLPSHRRIHLLQS